MNIKLRLLDVLVMQYVGAENSASSTGRDNVSISRCFVPESDLNGYCNSEQDKGEMCIWESDAVFNWSC